MSADTADLPPGMPEKGSRSEKASGKEIEGQIRRLRELWAEAFNARDLDASLIFYADDAVVLPPNGIAVRGIAAIRDLLKSIFETGYSQGRFEQSHIEYSGNMAVEVGVYTVQTDRAGSLHQNDGRYMATWRRQQNGEFRITVNVWSSN
ncbi:MAG: YybH family protein [Candidatus Acidiferrales bacterium]